MKLNPSAFNSFLGGAGGIGQDMLWRRSAACPCINPNSGAAKTSCVHCSGKGRIWANPIRVRAGVANQTVSREWAQFGQWESGDSVVSVPESSPMYDAGQFDRVIMLNGSDRFSLVLTRGMNDRVNVPVKSVLRVFWYGLDNSVVEGGIPTVSPAGLLHWTSGEPPVGTQYSITGLRSSEYFVWGPLPSDRGEHFGARLPVKMVLRKFDLFGR